MPYRQGIWLQEDTIARYFPAKGAPFYLVVPPDKTQDAPDPPYPELRFSAWKRISNAKSTAISHSLLSLHLVGHHRVTAGSLGSVSYLENLDILPQLHSIFIHRLSLALQGGGIQRQLEVTSRSAPPIEYAPAPSIPPLPSTYSIIGKALIPQASDRSNEVLYLGWRQEDEKTVENSEWISEASLDKEEWYTFTKNAIDRTGSIILPSPPPFITFLDLDEYRAHHAELSAKAKLLMANFPPISGDDTQSEAIEEREEDSEVEEEGKSESTVRNASPIAAGNAKSFSADSGSTRSSRRRKRAKGSPSSSSSADDQHHRKRIDDRGERYPSEVP